jgi:hypothetical protein
MKFQFETACPGILIRMKENLELLGIPIFEEAYGESFVMKEHKLELGPCQSSCRVLSIKKLSFCSNINIFSPKLR